MGNALRRVQSGDPLKIPAATFNSMIDAAAAHRARAHDVRQVPQPAPPHDTILLVHNTSGAAGSCAIDPSRRDDPHLLHYRLRYQPGVL